jgi:hypothetical protein
MHQRYGLLFSNKGFIGTEIEQSGAEKVRNVKAIPRRRGVV